MQTDHTTTEVVLPKLGGWAALAMFLLWLLAFISAVVIQSNIFPNISDQFIPAKIQANVLVASLGWLIQLAMGTVLIALAFSLSYYLATPLSLTIRLALIAGIVAGVFLIAAGAGGQENIFTSVFYTPQMVSEVSKAMGTPDLTVINVVNSVVAGGFRSSSAYASGWAMALWSIAALRTRKLPALLNWIGIITAILYALTVWIGPFSGLPSFIGLLVWHLWLGLYLLRSKQVWGERRAVVSA